MTFDPFTIIMLAVLAVLIFFMFRNSRKRQADAQQLQSKVQPGAKVMTNFGVFGTILSIDEEENQVAPRDLARHGAHGAPPDHRPRGRARRGRAP